MVRDNGLLLLLLNKEIRNRRQAKIETELDQDGDADEEGVLKAKETEETNGYDKWHDAQRRE